MTEIFYVTRALGTNISVHIVVKERLVTITVTSGRTTLAVRWRAFEDKVMNVLGHSDVTPEGVHWYCEACACPDTRYQLQTGLNYSFKELGCTDCCHVQIKDG